MSLSDLELAGDSMVRKSMCTNSQGLMAMMGFNSAFSG